MCARRSNGNRRAARIFSDWILSRLRHESGFGYFFAHKFFAGPLWSLLYADCEATPARRLDPEDFSAGR